MDEDTFGGYQCGIESSIYPYFADKGYTLADLEQNPRLIKDYYDYKMDTRKVKANTVIHRHANIRKALQELYVDGIINNNPADRVKKPIKEDFVVNIYNSEELDQMFKVFKGDPLELIVILAGYYGLCRSEIIGLKWENIDFVRKTISIKHVVTETSIDGKLKLVKKNKPKTKASTRSLPLVPQLEELLVKALHEQQNNAKLFGDSYNKDYTEYINVDPSGNLIKSNFVTQHFRLICDKNELKHIRFHNLRHPYVKHTTKIFSLRLMDFQAQAYPDARRKTRGACQLLRVGQSRSPVRPLCNRKRFSCLPPQSKMSWILYAISMRLSGYTSTRSISSSASSVVSVSASKIALDASMRLSCRACSSCFCFACANTAA